MGGWGVRLRSGKSEVRADFSLVIMLLTLTAASISPRVCRCTLVLRTNLSSRAGFDRHALSAQALPQLGRGNFARNLSGQLADWPWYLLVCPT